MAITAAVACDRASAVDLDQSHVAGVSSKHRARRLPVSTAVRRGATELRALDEVRVTTRAVALSDQAGTLVLRATGAAHEALPLELDQPRIARVSSEHRAGRLTVSAAVRRSATELRALDEVRVTTRAVALTDQAGTLVLRATGAANEASPLELDQPRIARVSSEHRAGWLTVSTAVRRRPADLVALDQVCIAAGSVALSDQAGTLILGTAGAADDAPTLELDEARVAGVSAKHGASALPILTTRLADAADVGQARRTTPSPAIEENVAQPFGGVSAGSCPPTDTADVTESGAAANSSAIAEEVAKALAVSATRLRVGGYSEHHRCKANQRGGGVHEHSPQAHHSPLRY